MNEFNINEIDFYSLDIDKYLNYLIDKYNDFSLIRLLVFYDNIIDDLQVRKYFAYSHYLKTRNTALPISISNAYDIKIRNFQELREKYKGLHLEIIFFDCVSYNNDYKKEPKEYGFFNKEELKSINIDLTMFNTIIKDYKNGYLDDVDFIEERRKISPLQDVDFYKKELEKTLQNFEFVYLKPILNGQFIYNLNETKNALSFSTEIDKIKLAIYLSEKINGQTYKHSIIKPIKWNGKTNELATIFYSLKKSGLISASDEDLKRLIINNFVKSDNCVFSSDTLKQIFIESKGKLNANVLQEIKPLLLELTKNSPQT
jgi:hypothetical protein